VTKKTRVRCQQYDVELPGEVRGGAVDDVVVLPLHLQERAVLAAVLPELHTAPQTAI